MKLADYWSQIRKTSIGWVHPDDLDVLSHSTHSFNLDFPPPAFVGNVQGAKVIVLTANGGYSPTVTPQEFAAKGAEALYVKRLAAPAEADWSAVAPYYNSYINYADLLVSGRLATVNACAYRSVKISQEPQNRRVVRRLRSVQFNKQWLLDVLLPQANKGKRLIIGKRQGLWDLPQSVKASPGYLKDMAPISPFLSRAVMERVLEVLG